MCVRVRVIDVCVCVWLQLAGLSTQGASRGGTVSTGDAHSGGLGRGTSLNLMYYHCMYRLYYTATLLIVQPNSQDGQ